MGTTLEPTVNPNGHAYFFGMREAMRYALQRDYRLAMAWDRTYYAIGDDGTYKLRTSNEGRAYYWERDKV